MDFNSRPETPNGKKINEFEDSNLKITQNEM